MIVSVFFVFVISFCSFKSARCLSILLLNFAQVELAKIKAHINYAVNLPILIPIQTTKKHIIHS